ncbi:cytochrome b subunit of succinate dehydrogenase, Sdh3p [Malassezia equina]|uniref:Cytochrome b subunit of succinate dehydrogenase, Sdh3p n=1 Tax=Malassezia equina TaxID=1381935 RepID=A0AAF0EC04_9BASI|nr:cytochrome b subunit of succinate dehydrogenase, Sdh3p [Malassezia equina]
MSLFVASRLVYSPLASTQGVLGAMRLAPRALHTSPVSRALNWSKQQPAKVVSLTEEQDLKQLNQRRNQRPISPHLTIYQPQLTWYSSIANRITGVGMSAGLYAYAIAYLAAPHAGLGELFSSGSLVDIVSHMPTWAKLAIKAPLAATFSYHLFNGLRHLSWDWGFFLQLRTSYVAGYTVLAATAASTVALCML